MTLDEDSFLGEGAVAASDSHHLASDVIGVDVRASIVETEVGYC